MTTPAKRRQAAQLDHDHLQGDLQHLEKLLHDNEQAEATARASYRAGEATFDQVREAMTSTHTARELLDQQRSDIAVAAAELKAATEAETRAQGVAEINAISGKLRELQEAVSDSAGAMLDHMASCSLEIAQLQREHAALRDAWRGAAREKLDLSWDLLNSRDLLSYLKGEGVDIEPLSRAPRGTGQRDSLGGSTPDPWTRPLSVTLPEPVRALMATNAKSPILQQSEVDLYEIQAIAKRLVSGATNWTLEPAEAS